MKDYVKDNLGTLIEDYKDIIVDIESIETFIKELYPPLVRAHLIGYGEKINNFMVVLSSRSRELQFIKISLNKKLKDLEKDLKEDHYTKSDIQDHSEYVDIVREISFVDTLLNSINSLSWTLKESKNYFLSLYTDYTK